MTTMTITKASEIPGETTLKVEVPVDYVQAARNKAASKFAKRAKVKGFRKGKVPRDVVLRMYKDGIRESVLQELVNESWKTAVEQEGLKPIADPRIKDLQFEDDQPLTFQLMIETKPELKLDRISGFEVKRKSTKITDAQVDEQLEAMTRKKSPWAPVEGEKAQIGDLLTANVVVLTKGQKEAEPKPAQLVIGDGSAIPEIEERLMEMEIGEKKETSVRYPDDFPDETMRGQSRSVRLELLEIKRQDLAELDDEFAREMGDFETLDDLKKVIGKDLQSELDREADVDVRRQIIELISTANNVAAPDGMVHRFTAAYAEGYEVGQDQFEGFANEFRPMAESQVRRDLILDAISEQNGLKATEDDIDEKVAEIAKQRNAEPGEVYASLEKAKRLNELERGITERKIFDFLLAQNTIVDEL